MLAVTGPQKNQGNPRSWFPGGGVGQQINDMQCKKNKLLILVRGPRCCQLGLSHGRFALGPPRATWRKRVGLEFTLPWCCVLEPAAFPAVLIEARTLHPSNPPPGLPCSAILISRAPAPTRARTRQLTITRSAQPPPSPR